MKVYIAGPMRGIPDFNFPAFDRAAARLSAMGWEVINPAEEDRKANEVHTEEEVEESYKRGEMPWIRRDVEIIMSLRPFEDAIYMLPGWEKSKGATAEKALGEWRQVRILFEEIN